MASSRNIPEDAILEILLRLPVKSLVRLRCVSKSWFALLKSPNFLNMHLKFSLAGDDAYERVLIFRYIREERKAVLSIHSNDKSLGVVTPNFDVQDFKADADLELLGSINGIICIYSLGEFLLCNPATSQFRKLPRPFECPQIFLVRTNAMGFGFDPATNDYKVVRITYTGNSYHKTEIYNLSNDTWRELDTVVPTTVTPFGENVLFNGRIHWFTSTKEDNLPGILSFNLSKEIVHYFRFPEAYKMIDFEEMPQIERLGVIHDSLAMIWCTSSFPDPHPYEQYINIWMMKEYGVEESWTRQYSIGPFSGIERPISIWKNEQLLLDCEQGECCIRGDTAGNDGQLVACDLLNLKQLQKYDIYGDFRTLQVTFYRETLVSIV